MTNLFFEQTNNGGDERSSGDHVHQEIIYSKLCGKESSNETTNSEL
jgi:hypothetical protein